MIEFDAFFRRVVGRPPPAVLYFAQGAQFGASRAALRSTPRATYQWILELIEAGHLEVTFYLEMMWHYVLHGAPRRLTLTLSPNFSPRANPNIDPNPATKHRRA